MSSLRKDNDTIGAVLYRCNRFQRDETSRIKVASRQGPFAVAALTCWCYYSFVSPWMGRVARAQYSRIIEDWENRLWPWFNLRRGWRARWWRNLVQGFYCSKILLKRVSLVPFKSHSGHRKSLKYCISLAASRKGWCYSLWDWNK